MTEEQAVQRVLDALNEKQDTVNFWNTYDLNRPASIAMVIRVFLALTKDKP